MAFLLDRKENGASGTGSGGTIVGPKITAPAAPSTGAGREKPQYRIDEGKPSSYKTMEGTKLQLMTSLLMLHQIGAHVIEQAHYRMRHDVELEALDVQCQTFSPSKGRARK